MNLSPVLVANLALDELPAPQITNFGENTLEAKVCARQYGVALAELLEFGEWSFAIRRVQLAEVDNDRTGEWGGAYALPDDVALPLRLVRVDPDPSGVVLQAGQAEPWRSPLGDLGIPYGFATGVIYTGGGGGAVLEYVTKEPKAQFVTAQFVKALVFLLASKIAMPLTKDRDLKDKLWQEAELYRDRAIAADLNRQVNTYGDNFIPAAIAAAVGGLGGVNYASSFDLPDDPGIVPDLDVEQLFNEALTD